MRPPPPLLLTATTTALFFFPIRVVLAQYMETSFAILATITDKPTITPTVKNTDATLLSGRPECQNPVLVSTVNSLFFHVGCSWENEQCCPSPTPRANRQYFDNCPEDYDYVDPDGTGTMLACCPKGFNIVRIAINRLGLADPLCASPLPTPLTLNSTAPAYMKFFSQVTANPSMLFAMEFYVSTKNGNKMVVPTASLTSPTYRFATVIGGCTATGTTGQGAAVETGGGAAATCAVAGGSCIAPTTLAGSVAGTAAGAVVLSVVVAGLLMRRRARVMGLDNEARRRGGVGDVVGSELDSQRAAAEMAGHRKRVLELQGAGGGYWSGSGSGSGGSASGIGEVEGDRIMPPEMATIEQRRPGEDMRKDPVTFGHYL